MSEVEVPPPAFVTVQVRFNVPGDPAVKIMALVEPPRVMEPFAMVQTYVNPAWVGTDAV
jgi:hypothetical protein